MVPACVTRALNSEILHVLHVCEKLQKNLSSDSFSMISGEQAKPESLSGSPPTEAIGDQCNNRKSKRVQRPRRQSKQRQAATQAIHKEPPTPYSTAGAVRHQREDAREMFAVLPTIHKEAPTPYSTA